MFGRNKSYYTSKGDSQYEKNQLAKAVKTYSKAISFDNDDTDLLFKRGNVYLDMQDYKNAILDYDAVISKDKDDESIGAYFNRSIANYSVGKIQMAINDISKYIEFVNDDADVYIRRSSYHWKSGDLDKAYDDISQAIELSPTSKAYCFRSELQMSRKDFDNALEDCEVAIKLSPKDVNVNDQMGYILMSLKREDEAIEYWENAVSLGSTNERTYFGLGVCHFKEGDFGKVIAYLEKTISINSDFAPAATYHYLGMSYFAIGQWQKCVASLEKALSFDRSINVGDLLKNARKLSDAVRNGRTCKTCKWSGDISESLDGIMLLKHGWPKDKLFCSIKAKELTSSFQFQDSWQEGRTALLIRNVPVMPNYTCEYWSGN